MKSGSHIDWCAPWFLLVPGTSGLKLVGFGTSDPSMSKITVSSRATSACAVVTATDNMLSSKTTISTRLKRLKCVFISSFLLKAHTCRHIPCFLFPALYTHHLLSGLNPHRHRR